MIIWLLFILLLLCCKLKYHIEHFEAFICDLFFVDIYFLSFDGPNFLLDFGDLFVSSIQIWAKVFDLLFHEEDHISLKFIWLNLHRCRIWHRCDYWPYHATRFPGCFFRIAAFAIRETDIVAWATDSHHEQNWLCLEINGYLRLVSLITNAQAAYS
jgi:hypothetical protein